MNVYSPTKIVALFTLISITLTIPSLAADWYWKGSGAGDNIDENGNWWVAGNPASGDNLYFNNSAGLKQPYSNYGAGSYFGNIIVYNGANPITWSGDTTYAYKFENNNSPDLFKIQSNIGNRSDDMQINPVGSGGMQITGNVSMGSDNHWLKIYGSDDLDISGVISGNAGVDVTIYNTPTVILSGENTWPDAFNIYGGIVDLRNTTDPLDVTMINLGDSSGSQAATLQIGANGVDVDNNITIVSGSGTKALKNNFAGTGEFSGDITMSDNLTVSAIAGSTLELSGDIYGNNKTVTFNDSGTVILSGASSNTLITDTTATGFDIQNGTLKTSENGQTGSPGLTTANYIKLDNWAIFQATDTYSLNGDKGIEIQSGHGKIAVDAGKTLTVYNDITGGNEFAKTGLGTLYLGGGDEFTVSQLYIDAGVLWPIETTPFNGTLTTVNLGATNGSDFAGLKLGSGGTTKSMDKSITVRAGSSGTKTIENGNSGDNCNFNGQIILNDGLTLIATNGSTVVIGGGLDMSATGNQNFTITGSNDVTISGVIEADSGAAQLNHNGTGTLLLSGDNDSAVNQMMVNIGNSGTIEVSDAYGLGDDPSALYSDKINFIASGELYNTIDVTLTSDAGITIADGITASLRQGSGTSIEIVVNGEISDGASNDGQLTKQGAGQLHLLGANTYGGATTIEGGQLRIGADNGLGSQPGGAAPGHIVINGGTLYSTTGFEIDANRGISLGFNNGTIQTYSGTLIYSGDIAGSGVLTKEGSGTLDLSAGSSSYTNRTVIEAGALRIGSDASLGATPSVASPGHILLTNSVNSTLYADQTFELHANRGIELASTGGDVQVYNGKTLTYGGIIAGSGPFTKTGAGTLVLIGANTYSGETTVDTGTLTLGGSHTGGGAYTVNSGATLTGGGSTDAAVTLASGATIQGGSSGSPGTLNLGDLTLVSGSTFKTEADGSATYGQVDVTGTVDLGGSDLALTLNYAPAPGSKFVLIQNNESDAVTGTFNGLVEGATVSASYNSISYTFMINYAAEGSTKATAGGNDVMLRDTRIPPTVFKFN